MTLLLRWLYQMLLLTLPSLPGRVTEIAFRRKHTAVSLVEGGKTKNVVVKSYSTDFAHGAWFQTVHEKQVLAVMMISFVPYGTF